MKYKLLSVLLVINSGFIQAQPWAQLVKDACTGNCGNVAFQHAYNNKLYYLGYDDQHGNELWTSDGTTAGTQLLKDINPDPQGESNPLGFVETGGKLFFLARTVSLGEHKIFVTDGTAAGTISPRDVGYIDKLIPFNSEVYFSGFEAGNTPKRLWKSDGTTSGTIPLTNFPGIIAKAIICKNKLFLIAPEMTGSQWLWVTDGTAAGTAKVSNDIIVQQNIGVVNDKVCFYGYDGRNGISGVFITDGTAAGTELLEQIYEVKSQFGMLNNKLYYLTTSGPNTPAELHVTDGTVQGTQSVKQLGILSMRYDNAYTIGNKLAFITNSYIVVTDGTASGTIQISTNASSFIAPVVSDNKLFYTSGQEYLWVSDGTAAGTYCVDTNTFVSTNTFNTGELRTFMVANRKVYFEGNEKVLVNGRYRPGRSRFYAADATGAKAAIPSITTSSTLFDYAVLNNELYIAANDSVAGVELWKITDFPTGVQQSQQAQIATTIYPNPATNTFSVKNSGATVKVYSLTGQLMLETKETQNINIQHLPPGIYQVQIIINGQTHTEKLIKE